MAERESAPAENVMTDLLSIPEQDGVASLILLDEVLMYARQKVAEDKVWLIKLQAFFQALTQAAVKADNINALVEQLDEASIRQAIDRHALNYSYEFRVLIHVLATIDPSRLTAWANLCGPQVEAVVANKSAEAEPVLAAFHRLNPSGAEALSIRYQVALRPLVVNSSDRLSRVKALREKIKRQKDCLEDFDTEFLKHEES